MLEDFLRRIKMAISNIRTIAFIIAHLSIFRSDDRSSMPRIGIILIQVNQLKNWIGSTSVRESFRILIRIVPGIIIMCNPSTRSSIAFDKNSLFTSHIRICEKRSVVSNRFLHTTWMRLIQPKPIGSDDSFRSIYASLIITAGI